MGKEEGERIGVEPKYEVTFTTIDGRKIRRMVGGAEIEVMGRSEITLVVFGENEHKGVSGVHALEGLRLEVDPLTGRLK